MISIQVLDWLVEIPTWHLCLSLLTMSMVTLMSYLLVKPLGYITVTDVLLYIWVMAMSWMYLFNVYILIVVLLYLILFHAKSFFSAKVFTWKD